ncbi:MAG TPA: DUF502 domain-containing protein [Syntrophales bacterium]|nr:DUF502 domain-containing protein [Syntrophales bacterium]
MKKKLKQIFLTGLAVTVPIGLTLYILFFLIDIMDSLLKIIPTRYHPDTLLGVHIPGLGIIVTVILIFICGLITASYVGNRIVQSGEDLLYKIPFVRSIYQAIKRFSDTMVMDRRSSFKHVVLVEFPRKGLYTIGFVTGKPNLGRGTESGENLTSVFLPTTPNPTSGYLIIAREDELVEVNMTVEEALTYIISVGIVSPSERIRKKDKPETKQDKINQLEVHESK